MPEAASDRQIQTGRPGAREDADATRGGSDDGRGMTLRTVASIFRGEGLERRDGAREVWSRLHRRRLAKRVSVSSNEKLSRHTRVLAQGSVFQAGGHETLRDVFYDGKRV